MIKEFIQKTKDMLEENKVVRERKADIRKKEQEAYLDAKEANIGEEAKKKVEIESKAKIKVMEETKKNGNLLQNFGKVLDKLQPSEQGKKKKNTQNENINKVLGL